MASNDFEIVNLALVRLGATRITSLSDGSRNANEANAIYSLIRDEVLRGHAWNWATRVADLEAHIDNVLTITDITQANPGVVTYTGTDPADGDEYKIAAVVGMTELNGNIYTVQNVNTVADTFELYDDEGKKLNTTTYTAYGSAGTATEQITHESAEYDNVFHLPDDNLRILELNKNPEALYEVIEDHLFTNEDEGEVQYIKQVTTVTTYDANFVNAFAWRLAAELCVVLTGSMKKVQMCWNGYDGAMTKARNMDASEGNKTLEEFDKYKTSRR
jgi:hypothetical protein